MPPELTQAIARVESGGTPYALNVAGRGSIFGNKADAVAAAEKASEAGHSFDSGIMQINNWWLKRYGIPLEAAFDPVANILLGSWILKQELDRGGDTWKAVARYHSPDTDRGNQYATLVRQALEKEPIQNAANSFRCNSLAHTKKETSVRLTASEPSQSMPTPLVVYRSSVVSPVFARVPAAHRKGESLNR